MAWFLLPGELGAVVGAFAEEALAAVDVFGEPAGGDLGDAFRGVAKRLGEGVGGVGGVVVVLLGVFPEGVVADVGGGGDFFDGAALALADLIEHPALGVGEEVEGDDEGEARGTPRGAVAGCFNGSFVGVRFHGFPCLVLGSRFSVLGSQFAVRSSQFAGRGARFWDVGGERSWREALNPFFAGGFEGLAALGAGCARGRHWSLFVYSIFFGFCYRVGRKKLEKVGGGCLTESERCL